MKRKIVFYKTQDNKCPVEDFIDSLSGKVAKKVIWVFKLLEELESIPETYFKKLSGTKGIWECRIKFGSNSYRILCFNVDKTTIMLTNGFIKKTNRIPKVEIERAESFREEFNRRKNYE